MSDNGKVPAIHDLNVRANELACENDILTNRVKVLEEALRELVYDINLKHGINIENMVGVSTRACLERARKALEADNG